MEEGRRSIEITSSMHRKVQLLSDFLLLMFIILIFFSIFMAIVLYAKCYYEEEEEQSRIQQLDLNRVGFSCIFVQGIGLLSFTSH